MFYNQVRLHASLDYAYPLDFERKFEQNSSVNGTGGGVPVAAQGYVPLNHYF